MEQTLEQSRIDEEEGKRGQDDHHYQQGSHGLPDRKMLVAYWITSVGIGQGDGSPDQVLPGDQRVIVPLTELLNYKRLDGSPQVNVVHLTGANFTFRKPDEPFTPPYLTLETDLLAILQDGRTIPSLQAAGIKVVVTIMGYGNGHYGWSSIPKESINDFVEELKKTFIDNYHLDGIDIDDEYARVGDNIIEVITAVAQVLPKGIILSKALYNDWHLIPHIKDYLTYGGMMRYGGLIN